MIGFAFLINIPVVVLLAEVLAATALARERRPPASAPVRSRVAVLVPAHDESGGIVPTLADIKAQLYPNDRLLVVADNCSDDTAAVADGTGAEVVVRDDPDRRGKGYALDFGLRHLSADPPDLVIVIDADCRLAEHTIDRLAATSAATGRPVQALDLMLAPEPSAINRQVAVFAWRLKNWVRPLGLSALGLPCQLMGTGMAFPWETIRCVDLASGAMVEDLKLGLELAAAGHAPVFCPAAVVTSEFPLSETGAATQRERWEQGHIGLIISAMPRFVLSAIAHRDWQLLALALDLAVPPLALLLLLLLVAVTASGLAALAGIAILAFQLSVFACLAFAASVVLAWWSHGRTVLPASSLLLLPAYVWGKCRLYAALLTGKRATRWIRTERR